MPLAAQRRDGVHVASDNTSRLHAELGQRHRGPAAVLQHRNCYLELDAQSFKGTERGSPQN